MKQVIKLMPDYGCYPLWWAAGSGKAGDIDPTTLPLRAETIQQLEEWANIYDRLLNESDPASSGFKSDANRDAFETEGIRLWQQLRDELSANYKVYYFSQRLQENLIHPSQLKALIGGT